MRKKVLLLNPPFARPVQRDYGCPHGVKSAYYWPPIDMLLFGAAAGRVAHLAYLDAIAAGRDRSFVVRHARRERPDEIFVVLSSITLDEDLGLVAELRGHLPDARVWASGDVTFFGSASLPGVDFQVRDPTYASAIRELLAGDAPGGVVPPGPPGDFSVGVCPHDLTLGATYSMPYSHHRRVTSVLTNYGCPFPCTFCNSNALPFKRRAVREVVDELAFVQRLGIREFVFRDFTFGLSDVDRICEEMLRTGLRLKWSCWTSPSLVDRRVLRKMKAAGCYLVALGAESGDERVLELTRKPALDRVRSAVAAARAEGVEVLTSFVIGFAGEDRARTESAILELDPDYLALNLLAPRLGSVYRAPGSASAPETPRSKDSLCSGDKSLEEARDLIERRFFLRPRKILRYVRLGLGSPYRLSRFAMTALGLLRRWLRPRAGKEVG